MNFGECLLVFGIALPAFICLIGELLVERTYRTHRARLKQAEPVVDPAAQCRVHKVFEKERIEIVDEPKKANPKRVLYRVLTVILGLWLTVVAYAVTEYLMDLRYEQNVKRNQIEAIEESRIEAEKKRKEWLASAPERERLAKAAEQQRLVDAQARHASRVEEFKRDAEARAARVEANRIAQEEANRERRAQAAEVQKEYTAAIRAQDELNRAARRKMVEEDEARRRSAKQLN